MSDIKLREPSYEERLKIREALDKYFDDQAGCWLDDWSDQKAGAHANVPWAMVTRIREAAYGPIKVDPEVAAIRALLAQLSAEIKALAAGQAEAVRVLTEKAEAASKRVEALRARRVA